MFDAKYINVHTHNATWKAKSCLVVDNCYDSYTRNSFLRYINENDIKYIASQDYDLSYLSDCPKVEFVLCSPESNHLEALYSLRNLKGLSLYTDDNSFDFSKLAPSLSFLQTKYEHQNKSWLNNSSINDLSLVDYETENLYWLSNLGNKNKLRTFEIYNSYGKFRTLSGLKELLNLESLTLDYCRRLSDVAEITELATLKVLRLYDNPLTKNLPLKCLTTLEELHLIDTETLKPRTLESLAFIKSMPNLHTFWSNYNVLDGDLSLLLKLTDVDIVQDKKHYNIKNKDLPHPKK